MNQLAVDDMAGIVFASGWNNIGFPNAVSSKELGPVSINDSFGSSAATFQSTLTTGYVGYSGTAFAGPNGNFMRSYLSWDDTDGTPPDDTGNLLVSGLGSAYTNDGYNVIVYFDTDVNNRTHTITVGGTSVIGDDASTYDGDGDLLLFPGDPWSCQDGAGRTHPSLEPQRDQWDNGSRPDRRQHRHGHAGGGGRSDSRWPWARVRYRG